MPITLLKLFFAPRLYRIYRRSTEAGELYVPNMAERFGDFFISYGIPCGGIYCMWQRKLNYFIYWSVLIASSYAFRAMGRAVNPTYLAFMDVLHRSKQALTTENLEQLRKYDFEFKSWPIAYKCTRLSLHAQKLAQAPADISISWLLGWLVCHTFGIRLIYPGLLIGSFIRLPLEEARAKYIMERYGQRNRVQTVDNNAIDTMFFDRRNEMNSDGKILVICCEGNAGFYEVGMMSTPLELGYSVLGWNHPGFGGSSGVPYPPAELNAAEAVFDFAVNSLGFKEEQIVLYGWSIGGFPATHLARSHPNVKGLILDATFDDILPLAIPKMPEILSYLVAVTIRKHANLEISKELAGYGGPVRLIRRTEDEIISEPSGDLSANRGNYLLKSLLYQRFPELLDNSKAENALNEWISKPHARDASSLLAARRERPDVTLPESLSTLSDEEKKDLVIKIADLYLTDYKSTHCTPLPQSLFRLPWAHPPRPIANVEDEFHPRQAQ